MTFDIKRRLKLVFKPDAHATALEREAWGIIIAAVRKLQKELSNEIEDTSFYEVVHRIIEDGTVLEHVALLDGGLFGAAGDNYQIGAAEVQDIDADGTPGELLAAWLSRAKTFLRSVLKEGPAAGHVHHANGHARLP